MSTEIKKLTKQTKVKEGEEYQVSFFMEGSSIESGLRTGNYSVNKILAGNMLLLKSVWSNTEFFLYDLETKLLSDSDTRKGIGAMYEKVIAGKIRYTGSGSYRFNGTILDLNIRPYFITVDTDKEDILTKEQARKAAVEDALAELDESIEYKQDEVKDAEKDYIEAVKELKSLSDKKEAIKKRYLSKKKVKAS